MVTFSAIDQFLILFVIPDVHCKDAQPRKKCLNYSLHLKQAKKIETSDLVAWALRP